MDKNTFFQTYAPFAIDEQKRSGIPASVTLAQAAQESGYGSSGLVQKAMNFFGIKAGSGWTGASYFTPTTEYIAGIPMIQLASFRKYQSAADSFRDHSDFLKSNSRYSAALSETDPFKVVEGIAAAGYATDPGYASELKNIIKGNDLTKYDQPGAAAAAAPATPADQKTPWWDIGSKSQQFFASLAQNALIGIVLILVLVATGFIGYQSIKGEASK